MTPLDDPRPLAEVLRDWMARHGLTAYAAAQRLRVRDDVLRSWLPDAPRPRAPSYEWGLRCAMTLADEGRA